MKYVLNLSKTKAYEVMCQYVSNIPRMRECDFSHHGRTYWVRYDDPMTCERWKATIQTCMGSTSIRFYNIDNGSDTIIRIDPQWLLAHGMLKEVGRDA